MTNHGHGYKIQARLVRYILANENGDIMVVQFGAGVKIFGQDYGLLYEFKGHVSQPSEALALAYLAKYGQIQRESVNNYKPGNLFSYEWHS